jgi:hypothetical protein
MVIGRSIGELRHTARNLLWERFHSPVQRVSLLAEIETLKASAITGCWQ